MTTNLQSHFEDVKKHDDVFLSLFAPTKGVGGLQVALPFGGLNARLGNFGTFMRSGLNANLFIDLQVPQGRVGN